GGARRQVSRSALASRALLGRRAFRGGPARTAGRAIFGLPAVTAVWSNLHGGWPAGFLFLAIALACCVLRWLGDRTNAEHLQRARVLVLVGAASAGAVLVNPHGLAGGGLPPATPHKEARAGLTPRET